MVVEEGLARSREVVELLAVRMSCEDDDDDDDKTLVTAMSSIGGGGVPCGAAAAGGSGGSSLEETGIGQDWCDLLEYNNVPLASSCSALAGIPNPTKSQSQSYFRFPMIPMLNLQNVCMYVCR